MVPTKFVQAAVTMLTDTVPQPRSFVDQLLTCHLDKVFVHTTLLSFYGEISSCCLR
jgi:hypothetical protein